MLLGSAAVVTRAAVASSFSTQFIAWRVGYLPALSVTWAGHFYASWKWIEWLASPGRRRGMQAMAGVAAGPCSHASAPSRLRRHANHLAGCGGLGRALVVDPLHWISSTATGGFPAASVYSCDPLGGRRRDKASLHD